MVDVHFFSRRVVILSGPEALFGLRLLSALHTSARMISEIVSLHEGETVQQLSPEFFKNTELK
jgi:hypothetical protein